MAPSQSQPKATIDSLVDRGVDVLRLDRDVLTRELKSSSRGNSDNAACRRDWAIYLSKKELGGGLIEGNDQPRGGNREPAKGVKTSLELLRGELDSAVSSSILSNTPPENLSQTLEALATAWINAPSAQVAFPDIYAQLDMDSTLSATATADQTSREVLALTTLVQCLTKDKGSLLLKREYFRLLVHVDSDPAVPDCRISTASYFPTVRDFMMDLAVLNESLEPENQHHDKRLKSELDAVWSPAKRVLKAFAFAHQRRCVLTNSEKQMRSLSPDLKSFDEFWMGPVEGLKRKGGKKTSSLLEDAAVNEADLLFKHWIEHTVSFGKSFEEKLLQRSIDEMLAAVEAFRTETESALGLCRQYTFAPSVVSRFREAKENLQEMEPAVKSLLDEILEKAAAGQESLRQQLHALETAYFGQSSKTLLGRLEKCSNREYRKKIKDLENAQAKFRNDLLADLRSVIVHSPPVTSAAIICLEATLAAGEALEATTLTNHLERMETDATLSKLCDRKRFLRQTFETMVLGGRVELGRIIARIFLNEGERLVLEKVWKKGTAGVGSTDRPSSASRWGSEAPSGLGDGPSKTKKRKNKKGGAVEGVKEDSIGAAENTHNFPHSQQEVVPKPTPAPPGLVGSSSVQSLSQSKENDISVSGEFSIVGRAQSPKNLAPIVDTLRGENHALRSENVALRTELAALTESSQRMANQLTHISSESAKTMQRFAARIAELESSSRNSEENARKVQLLTARVAELEAAQTAQNGAFRGGGPGVVRQDDAKITGDGGSGRGGRGGHRRGGYQDGGGGWQGNGAALSSGRRSRDKPLVRCSNCWSVGHESANCEAACRYCGGAHLSDQCGSITF
ncbi:hypothetical protein HK104_008682 [Borealophlyctis nickersoniae]|nr:hypothetical protein HK104_008682 [Borealophlyctis nickersoniae]